MRIKQVTVGFGVTASLPDYNNVRPSITLTADIDAGDDILTVISRLEDDARAYVESAVDDELERMGYSPKYYKGPLYRVWYWWQRGAMVILPHGYDVEKNLPGYWEVRSTPQRYPTAVEVAYEMAQEKEYEVLEVPLLDDVVKLHRWWEEQRWYMAYGLRNDYGQWGKIVCVQVGLRIPTALMILRTEFASSRRARSLNDLVQALGKDSFGFDQDQIVIVIDDQEALNEVVQKWKAEHPLMPVEEDVPF